MLLRMREKLTGEGEGFIRVHVCVSCLCADDHASGGVDHVTGSSGRAGGALVARAHRARTALASSAHFVSRISVALALVPMSACCCGRGRAAQPRGADILILK